MSEYNIQMNKYNALNAEYDQLYPQPMKHASTHAKDGSDPITPADIGAYSKNEADTLLANKAPSFSSYSAGSNSEIDAALNDLMNKGIISKTIFSAINITIGGLDLDGGLWGIELVNADGFGYAIATSYDSYGVVRKMRKYLDGVWKPWEYVNPPMVIGVEYRTTERYLGNPVYVKLVDCGALPNATTKIVEYGDSVCRPIFGYGISPSSNTFPSVNYGGGLAESFNSLNLVSLWLNGNAVLIACGGDRSALNAYVFVKYWKTTD